jgi:Tfp pilus assembly protein PilN
MRARKLLAAAEEKSGAAQLAIAVAAGRGVRPLDLIPDTLRPRRLTRPQMTTLGLAAVAVLLAVIALLAPGYRARRQLAALNADIARMAPDVRGVEKVLGELEAKRRLLATIESLEATAIRPLPVLRELTDLLPSDAWLTTVSLDNKGIELTGQAAAASGLIPVLENSPRFARVEFASPVTRGRDKEQFRIRAAWETPTAASDLGLGAGSAATMPVGPPPVGPPPAPAAAASPPAGAPPPTDAPFSVSIRATTVCTGTVCPSGTTISASTPAAGAGISASTLSVEISKIGSSRFTSSPTFLSHFDNVPSAMDSPIWGMITSTRANWLPSLCSAARGIALPQPPHDHRREKDPAR